MLKKGLAPKTTEAVYAYCLKLSEDQVRQLLIDMLNTEAEPMDKSSFGSAWKCHLRSQRTNGTLVAFTVTP